MAVDFKAIADAIALRFAAAVSTPPSGEDEVSRSTASLPDAISDDHTVLVFPAEVEFEYQASARKGVATYPVRFYLWKLRDSPAQTERLNDWATALHTVLDGQVHLGLSSYVNHAEIVRVEPGRLTYAGTEYQGIEFTVRVHFGYGVTFTA